MIRNLFLPIFLSMQACTSVGTISNHSSSLEVYSMGLDRVVLQPNCTTIVCTNGFANEGEIWMTDIPLDQLSEGTFSDGQILHLQVLWTPVAGKTPLTATSTNLSIEHVIIAEGTVGIYGGGGFCWLSGNPEKGMHVYVEDATIAIQEQSSGFLDLLTPATMNGRVRSVPDSTTARQIATAVELLR